MENKITFKSVVTAIVGFGVGEAMDEALDSLMPEKARIPIRIIRKIGIWAISWAAADYVCDHVENTCDKIYNEIKQHVDEAKIETDISESEVLNE